MSNIQFKMVVAYQKGNLYELRRFQHKLMSSFEARTIAVRQIVTNTGKSTPGVDGVVWKGPISKIEAVRKLGKIVQSSSKYKPKNIRRIWIPKLNSSELRPLGIPTVEDRALQALVLLALDPITEERSDLYSYGSRKFRSPHDALNRLRSLINKPNSPK